MNDLVLTRRLYAGAVMALGVCLMGLAIAAGDSGLWLAPLVALFLYLTYRTYTAGANPGPRRSAAFPTNVTAALGDD